MKRFKKLLLATLTAMMALVLSFGLAACGGEEEKTVTYSVTVACEDASVLGGVKVQLQKGGTPSEAKPLENGTAVFELEAGTYTVVLTGVPDEYSYESATVTESSPNASVTLTKLNEPDGKVFYTVNVTCEDEAVLSAVKVKLMLNSVAVSEEQALSEGKATFQLAPGDYTVTLTGVPAGYTYEPKTFTAPDYTVTIALIKESVSSAVDLSVKVAAGTDVFGKAQPETALANAKVEVYASETDLKPTATATTDANGVAHFDTLAKGSYLLTVNGTEFKNFAISASTATVTLNVPLGSEAAPIAWTVGENDLPFQIANAKAYCTLIVPETGLYSFEADNENVNVNGTAVLYGPVNHVYAQLNADIVYTFECATLAATGDLGYHLTVSKAGADAKPTYPWAGSGTESDPFILETFVGEYPNIIVEYDGTAFKDVYFKYVPAGDESYTVTLTQFGDAIVEFLGARPVVGQVAPTLSALESGNHSVDIKVSAGTDLILHITGGNDTSENEDEQAYSTFVCGFKVETYVAPEPETGSVYKPDTLTTLLGSHIVTTANTYYYLYHSTEAGVYAVSTAYSQGIVFTVRTELNPDSYGAPTGTKLYELKLSMNDSGRFDLEADKDYYFGIASNAQGEASGAAETLNFTVENFVAGEPDGTQANPYPLGDPFGEFTYEVDGAGTYFQFTLEEKTDVSVTAITSRYYIEFSGNTRWMPTSDGAKKQFTLAAGKVTLRLYNYTDATVTAHIKIEKIGGSETPITGSGTQADPEKVTALEGTYTREATYADGWYIEFTAKEAAIYTFTNNSSVAVSVRFGDASATGKGSSINKGTEKAFLTEANTDYVIVFFPQGSTKIAFSMTITKSALPSYPWQGEGTEASPYVLTGNEDLSLWVNSSTAGIYFKYTASAETDLTFTAQTKKVKIVLSDKNWGTSGNLATNSWTFIGDPSDAVRTLTLQAGETLTFFIAQQSGTDLNHYSVKFEVKSAASLPAAYNGNWKSVNSDYSAQIADGNLTLKKGETAVEAVLSSAAHTVEDEVETVWSVTFEGKTYALQWNVLGASMLQFFLSETDTIYFAPDPLPTVVLDETLHGEYADRAKTIAEHVVVSASGVAWAGHTVVLLDDVTSENLGWNKVYSAYVDGKPEQVFFNNGTVLFGQAGVYFDSLQAGTITLSDEFLGNWKSPDGKYTLSLTASSAELKENGIVAQTALIEKKQGSLSSYYLTWKGADWELMVTIPGILGLLNGAEAVYFSADPAPQVDLSAIAKGYYSTESALTYLVVSESGITWEDHVFMVVGNSSRDVYGNEGYPLFMDGMPYVLMLVSSFAGGGMQLKTLSSYGESLAFTFAGATQPVPNGSETAPYVLESLLGELTYENVGSDGIWCAFELKQDIKITVTAGSADFRLVIGYTTFNATSAGSSRDFTLKAGLIRLHFTSTKTDGSAVTVKVTIAQAAAAEGSSTAPVQILFVKAEALPDEQ